MKRNPYYILDDAGDPVPCADLITWGLWFEKAYHTNALRVGLDDIDDMRVSTVFLGLDHSWRDGPPILYETMVFGPDGDTDCRRYGACRQAALEGHNRVVAAIRAEVGSARRTATQLLDALIGAGPEAEPTPTSTPSPKEDSA